MSVASHSESVRDPSGPHKGRNPAISLPPSRDLGELVRGAIREPGRPVWRVASLAAPRVGWACDLDRIAAFRPDAWLYLEVASVSSAPASSAHGLAWQRLSALGCKQLLKLQAAILRDIWGESDEQIAERARYSDPSTARDRIKEGRELWAGLPAWPWACFENGRPPDSWRKGPLAGAAAAAFADWL